MIDPLVGALLFGAAVLGGAQNAVAGGGSFITFPSLIFAGVPPLQANATSAVALWPGSIASAAGYREDIKKGHRFVRLLAVAAVIGGVAGAFLLLGTPATTFRALVPWLLLTATVIFAIGPTVTRAFRARNLHMPMWLLFVLQLVIATYGGYFGGGMGIMMLAAYSAMGMEDVHMMNGLKSVMGVILNGVAILVFVVAGFIAWPFAIVMLAGSTVGGYAGARLGRRVPVAVMRWVIIGVGAALAFYFFVS